MGTLISVHKAYLEEITSLLFIKSGGRSARCLWFGLYVSVTERTSMSTIVPDCQ